MSSHVVLELAALTPLRNMLEMRNTVKPHPDLLTQKLWRGDPAIIFNKPSLYDPNKHKNFENQCRWVSGWVLSLIAVWPWPINVPEFSSWICKNEIVVPASKKLKKRGNTKCLAHSRCPQTLDSLIFICEHDTKNNQENNLPQFSSYIMCYVSS